jgi:hypothetical protein
MAALRFSDLPCMHGCGSCRGAATAGRKNAILAFQKSNSLNLTKIMSKILTFMTKKSIIRFVIKCTFIINVFGDINDNTIYYKGIL